MLRTATNPPFLADSDFEHLPLDQQAGWRLRRRADGSVSADWFGCTLTSVFQPIVDPLAGRVAGVEALLRIPGSGDRSLSPWNLFSTAADDSNLVALDRLCRTLHLLNAQAAGEDSLLFLNVHGRLLATVEADHGRAFRRVVEALGADPARIVIETPLAASLQPDLLAFVLRNYRQHGFQVAVNVESPAQWQAIAGVVRPQFVKIDGRGLGIGFDFQERLRWLDALREEAGLIVTRLEQPLPLQPAPGLWLQGYAYGRPAVLPPTGSPVVPGFLRR